MTTMLSTPDDIEWLRDVHLITCKRLPPFALAILDGNEDSPSKITLYEFDHVNSLTMELYPDADGFFRCDSERY